MHDDIVNTYDQLRRAEEEGVPPVAVLRYHVVGRDSTFAGFSVGHLTDSADPEARWPEIGKKVFRFETCTGGGRSARIENCATLAKGWASKKYGVKVWERNRTGDWVPFPLNTKFKIRSKPRKTLKS